MYRLKIKGKPVVVQTFNPNTQEAETDLCESGASLVYRANSSMPRQHRKTIFRGKKTLKLKLSQTWWYMSTKFSQLGGEGKK